MNAADFWRRVRKRDAELPRDADGKVSVDAETEDSSVIADPKAHESLPEEEGMGTEGKWTP